MSIEIEAPEPMTVTARATVFPIMGEPVSLRAGFTDSAVLLFIGRDGSYLELAYDEARALGELLLATSYGPDSRAPPSS